MNILFRFISRFYPLTRAQKEVRKRINALKITRRAINKVNRNGGLRVSVKNLHVVPNYSTTTGVVSKPQSVTPPYCQRVVEKKEAVTP